jgi:hypothetical protein
VKEVATMRRTPVLAFLAAACLAGAPALAPAFPVIDDFEAGPFSLSDPDDECASAVVGAHGIEPVRACANIVSGDPENFTALATLNVGPQDDSAVITLPTIGSFFSVEYRLAELYQYIYRDLTQYGLYDYVFITLSAPSSVKAYVRVLDIQGFDSGRVYATPNADGVAAIPLSAIPTANVTRTAWVVVGVEKMSGAAPAVVFLTDARLGRTPGGFAKWDSTDPPILWCPTCPPDSLALSHYAPLSTIPTHELLLTPQHVSGDASAIAMTAFDSGGDVGIPGTFAGSSVSWATAAGYTTQSFELHAALSPLDEVLPTFASPPSIVYADSIGFAIEYAVRLDDPRSGALVGNSVEHMTWDVMPGQPLRFEDVEVAEIPAGRAPEAPAFRISFKLRSTGNVDEGEPLFSSTLVGDFAEGAAPTSAPQTHTPVLAAPTLSAHPTVTTSGTRLRFSRAPAEAGEVAIFDVVGRIVRRLSVPRDAAEIHWDGRGTSGVALPAGVYFAALQSAGSPGADPHAAARIVRIR